MRYVIIIIALFLLAAPVFAQNSNIDIQRATTEVLRHGILQHDLDYESVIFDDFFTMDTSMNRFVKEFAKRWSVRRDSAANSTFTCPDSAFGMWYLYTMNGDNELNSIQYCGNPIKIRVGEPVECTWRVKLDTVKQADLMIGLADTTVAPLDSLFDTHVTDGIFWAKKDADTVWFAVTCSTSAAYRDSIRTSLAVYAYSDSDSYQEDGFHDFKVTYDGARTVRFYRDNRLYATQTESVPINRSLTPIFAIRNGAAFRFKLWFDYVLVTQRR